MKKTREKPLTNIGQIEIVTLVVFLLGGDQRSIDTEDVAIKAHSLAPGRFSWRKYPDQINLELVRVFLSDAKTSPNRAWLTGSGRTGWALTPAGLRWAKKAAPLLLGQDLSRERERSRAGSIDENRWRRERSRITRTIAWQRWNQGETNISEREASEVFRIDSYAVGRIRESKITRLATLLGDDPHLEPFIAKMAEIVRSLGGAT